MSRSAPALVLLVLAGCGGEPSGGRCSSTPYVGLVTDDLVVRDEGGTVWSDGTEVELIFGPQGGYMVTPVLEIDGALADGENPCLRVAVENADPGGSPIFDDFRVLETNRDFYRTLDGDLATGPIFDQVRWAPVPSGTPLALTITIRGVDFAARRTVTVALVPER